MMPKLTTTIATLLFTTTITCVHSSWLPFLSSVTRISSNNDNNFEHLQTKLSPGPGDVLDAIEEYTKFWIEVNDNKGNNCVWSECAVDDVDEENEGDNRDGDEQWYQVNV